jgi:ParB family chromosome partitioning protein
LRQDKPQKKEQRDWPEYKTCKSATEAIVTEGTEKGEIHRVCANPDCPVHHPRKQAKGREDIAFKAEQEKRRREEAVAQTTGLRVLKAIGEAVPVRLMKRDLLFVAERLTATLDERRVSVLIRQHRIGKPKDGEAPPKLLTAFLRKADESTLGRLLVEAAILQSMHSASDSARILREAAQHYKVDVDATSAKVKLEFVAKEKAKVPAKAVPPKPKVVKKPTAA